jgi:hypothetical protein
MTRRLITKFGLVIILAVLLIGSASAAKLSACPFCQPLKTTFAEDIKASDVAVLAELVQRPERPTDTKELPGADLIDSYRTKFRVAKIYRGKQHVKVDQVVEAIYTGDAEAGAMCLLRGVNPPKLDWAPPMAVSQRVQGYIEKIVAMPPDDPKRLDFFEDYLNDKDEMLRNDAFDEWARASYKDMQAVGDDIDHDRLIGWINDPMVLPMYRQLYFSMLSVCSNEKDIPMLERFLTSGDRTQLTGLNSMIFCYLTLNGEAGLQLIEDTFLRSGWMWDPEYVHTYAAIMAIRTMGQQEIATIPLPRLMASLRIMLDRPDLADLVIPDLARWEDWASMPRLVRLFKEADKESSWVRVPIVNFLRACPLPEAKTQLAELNKIDPDAVRRASTFFPFAPATTAQPEETNKTDDKAPKKPDAAAGAAADDFGPPADASAPSPANEEIVSDKQTNEVVAAAGIIEVGGQGRQDPITGAAPGAEAASSTAQGSTNAANPTAAVDSVVAADSTNRRFQEADTAVPVRESEAKRIALYVGVPVAVGVLLFLVMWLILRRPHQTIPSQHA